MMKTLENLKKMLPWIPEEFTKTDNIPAGDMPGDIVKITPEHIRKSRIVFQELLELIIPVLDENPYQRAVVSVYGGSGVGKSEIASLLSFYFNRIGLGSYTLSGDNYPHRIPKYNDAERRRVFRETGIEGLVANGQYNRERSSLLIKLQKSDDDSNPENVKRYPWLTIYQQAGWNGLRNYLGTNNEIDFKELTYIISSFKNGESKALLKRMGREETELWYEAVDFKDKRVMIIEWTHGNNHNLQGVDIPIFLNSTPQETLEHRKSRNRDGAVDSHFTTMVLKIEQELLISQVRSAKIILSKAGEILTYTDFAKLMIQDLSQEKSSS
jgi:alpha-galactosidase